MRGQAKDQVYIVFGDIIAYGVGDNECFGWVNRLKGKDNNNLKKFYFNMSIPGQCSTDIAKRFMVELKNRFNTEDEFKLLFAFGIKDALILNKGFSHLKIFEKNVLKIIHISQKFTKDILFLGLLDIDLEKRDMYKQANIEAIDSLLKQLCEENGVTYINMKNIVNLEELTDGLHPNNMGHAKIAEYIHKKITH